MAYAQGDGFPQMRWEDGTWFPLLPLPQTQKQFLRALAASREPSFDSLKTLREAAKE